MGFWGSLVLCRPGGELGEVEAIVSRDESVTEVRRPGGAWRVGQGEDTALIDDAEAFLRDLVAETGGPALLGYVLDSDCVDVVALGTTSGLWRSCLDRAAMQAYAEDEPLGQSILLPEAAAERAAQWASDAGLAPDLPALHSVFSRAGDELFAESLFFDLVDALGVSGAPAAMPSRPKKAPDRNRRRPTNPVDGFVFDFAADLLKSKGFTKRGRVFSRANASGDIAVVQFRSHTLGNLVDINLFGGVLPRPVADFAADLHGHRPTSPDAGDAAWQCDWSPPPRVGEQWPSATWSVKRESEREALGLALAQTLTTEVVPTLVTLLDRARLIEVVQNRGLLCGYTTLGAGNISLAMLADGGPSVALDQAIRALGNHPFERTALAWARGRLAEQGHHDDGWREGVWRAAADPYVRLAAMLAAVVDAPMRAAGFSRTGTRYQLVSGSGDHALVEFTPLAASPDPALRFRINSAVIPGPELEWHKAQAAAHPEWASGAIEPEARIGWLQIWHQPPPECALTDSLLPSLDAGLWTVTPDTSAACGAAIIDLLNGEVIPRLRELLDRTRLLARVLDPEAEAHIGYAHATIILLVDNGPSEQLEAALRQEEAGRGPTEPELAAWARARLIKAGRV